MRPPDRRDEGRLAASPHRNRTLADQDTPGGGHVDAIFPEPASGWKKTDEIGAPIPRSNLAAEVVAMNRRIDLRRAAAEDALTIPIPGPRWSDQVVDTGSEVVAIHKDTGTPYPVPLKELDAASAALVISRRILDAGGSTTEVRRFLGAFELEEHARRRLSRQLDEGGS